MNPWKALFESRKFWLLILDTVVSLVLYFVGKYAGPAFEDVKLVILSLQPIFLMLIYAIAYEDAKIIPAQISKEEAIEYNKTLNQPPVK
jgi:hypothetical protein